MHHASCSAIVAVVSHLLWWKILWDCVPAFTRWPRHIIRRQSNWLKDLTAPLLTCRWCRSTKITKNLGKLGTEKNLHTVLPFVTIAYNTACPDITGVSVFIFYMVMMCLPCTILSFPCQIWISIQILWFAMRTRHGSSLERAQHNLNYTNVLATTRLNSSYITI